MSVKFHAIKSFVSSKLETFFESYRKHNFYYRILAPFAVFSIILVCLSAGFSWYLLGNRYKQKIRETNHQILEQIQQYADQNLYENTTHILNHFFLGAYTSPELNNFFSYGSRLSDSDLLKCFQQTVNLCVQSDYIDYVTLYQKNDDLLIDSTLGLRYRVSGLLNTVDQVLPLSTYLEATRQSANELVYLTDENINQPCRNSLTLLRSIPLYSAHSESQGFIAIHFDEGRFLQDLKKQFAWNGSLFILSPDQEVILKSNATGPGYDFIKTVMEQKPGDDSYNYDFTYEGTRYCLTWVNSESSNWTYLSYVPMDILNEESTVIGQLILMFLLLIILFSLITVQKISSRVYQPIHRLRAKFETRNALPDSQDDLKAIEEAFSFLENQVDDIKQTTHANLEVLRYKVLIQLLYDNDFSDDLILQRLELCDITFEENGFCLILTDFDPAVFYSLDLEQRGYLTEKARELMCSWFSNHEVRIVEVHPDNQVVALMNLSNEQYDDFSRHADHLTDFLQTQLHIPVNHAVSNFTLELKEICRCYREALHFLQYFFIYNYGNTFLPDFIQKREEGTFSLEEKEKTQLETLLRTGRITELTSVLTACIKRIHETSCSYQDANLFLMQIYGITFRLCKEARLFEDPVRKNQIISDFKQSATLDASMECIYLMIHMYHEALNEESHHADTKLIQQVLDYLEHHCHDELTLQSVAEAFHVTPSHLSRLFKSVRGENFSTYVMNQKLTKAASLLLSCPERSIAQIAEGLGYYTPAYFTRIFKEKFGVTPSQYRKGNL